MYQLYDHFSNAFYICNVREVGVKIDQFQCYGWLNTEQSLQLPGLPGLWPAHCLFSQIIVQGKVVIIRKLFCMVSESDTKEMAFNHSP